MADSVAVQIAKAVYNKLVAATLSQTATKARIYDSTRELADVGTLHIDVLSSSRKVTPIGFNTFRRDIVTQVVIRKKLTNASEAEDAAEIDVLTLLIDEIEELFFRVVFSGLEVTWDSCETFGPMSSDLVQFHQFTAVMNITFNQSCD